MTYSDNFSIKATLVANEFIDKYMPKANGDYVKVYLYILRNSKRLSSVSEIAEALELTEGDVNRAVKYWEKLGVCSFSQESERCGNAKTAKELKGTAAEPEQKSNTSELRASYRRSSGKEALNRLSRDDEFSQLLFVVQKYMSKILTDSEQQVFAYLYDGLHLPCDVLDYLVDYCVQQGKDKIKYIEAVGLDWASSGIITVEAAKQRTKAFEKKKTEQTLRKEKKEAVLGHKSGTDYDAIMLDRVIGKAN